MSAPRFRVVRVSSEKSWKRGLSHVLAKQESRSRTWGKEEWPGRDCEKGSLPSKTTDASDTKRPIASLPDTVLLGWLPRSCNVRGGKEAIFSRGQPSLAVPLSEGWAVDHVTTFFTLSKPCIGKHIMIPMSESQWERWECYSRTLFLLHLPRCLFLLSLLIKQAGTCQIQMGVRELCLTVLHNQCKC